MTITITNQQLNKVLTTVIQELGEGQVYLVLNWDKDD